MKRKFHKHCGRYYRKLLVIFSIMFLLSTVLCFSQTKTSNTKTEKKKTVKTTKKKKAKKEDGKLKNDDKNKTDSTNITADSTKTSKSIKTSKTEQTLKGSSDKISPRTNVSDPEDDSMSGLLEWRIVLRDDNGNLELPPRFRNWWYIRLDGINNNVPSTLNIEGDGFPGKSVVIPVYSYDRINWHRLSPDDIINTTTKDGFFNYTIQKVFDSSSTVWLARYYPYSLSRLEKFLSSLEKNSFAKIEKIGTSGQGNAIRMITITDFKVDDKNKKRIWIHARTHPSETGSSFAVEGLVKYLISDCNVHCKKADLTKLIFHIVPMVNPDGVALGNARVTPDNSLDLERTWIKAENNYDLIKETAPETKALHSVITRLEKQGPEFIIALNLHSKNAYPNWRNFLYTNFKESKPEYGAEGDSLFKKQLEFTKILSDYYCGDTINVRDSEESGKLTEKKHFPEMWWWVNFKDKVMAATIETVSGLNGCFEDWICYRDHELLGEAIAKACNQYFKFYISKKYDKYERPNDDIQMLMKFYIK
ncbi:MAG: M14 family zinc carboxypeptidase [bacterium]